MFTIIFIVDGKEANFLVFKGLGLASIDSHRTYRHWESGAWALQPPLQLILSTICNVSSAPFCRYISEQEKKGGVGFEGWRVRESCLPSPLMSAHSTFYVCKREPRKTQFWGSRIEAKLFYGSKLQWLEGRTARRVSLLLDFYVLDLVPREMSFLKTEFYFPPVGRLQETNLLSHKLT